MAQGPLVVSAPREMVAKKPPHGEPCNHCGLCCYSSKCDIGRALFGASDNGPCPALRFDSEQKSFCNVVANPQQYTTHNPDEARAAAELLLYAGMGCTMRLHREMNLQFMARLEYFDLKYQSALDAAAALWGMPPKSEEMPF